MYSVRPKLATNYSTNDELNKLIELVDNRIVEIAIVAMNNYKYGFDNKVEMDKYKDLLTYRKILIKKLLGCNCLNDQLLIKIISKLKNLIK